MYSVTHTFTLVRVTSDNERQEETREREREGERERNCSFDVRFERSPLADSSLSQQCSFFTLSSVAPRLVHHHHLTSSVATATIHYCTIITVAADANTLPHSVCVSVVSIVYVHAWLNKWPPVNKNVKSMLNALKREKEGKNQARKVKFNPYVCM